MAMAGAVDNGDDSNDNQFVVATGAPEKPLGRAIGDHYNLRGTLGVFIPANIILRGAKPKAFKDDGTIEKISITERDTFLVRQAQSVFGRTADGQWAKIEISDWTNIIAPGESMTVPGEDTKKVATLDQAFFWLGSTDVFEGKGSYEIMIEKMPDDPQRIVASLRNVDMTWAWSDRVDAHSWREYDWKNNSTIQGLLEGLVDFGGDKILGASFNIRVTFVDTSPRYLKEMTTPGRPMIPIIEKE